MKKIKQRFTESYPDSKLSVVFFEAVATVLVELVEHTHNGENDQDYPQKTHAAAGNSIALSLGSADLVSLEV